MKTKTTGKPILDALLNASESFAYKPTNEKRNKMKNVIQKAAKRLEPNFKCAFDGWPTDEVDCPKCLSESPFHELDNPTRPQEQGEQLALPWRVIENYKGGIPLSVHTEDGRCIARIDWLPNGSGRASENCKMFAAYIVKAANEYPKLLGACKSALDVMRREGGNGSAMARLQDIIQRCIVIGKTKIRQRKPASLCAGQRDELLAALHRADAQLGIFEKGHSMTPTEAHKAVKTAIANAEGSAQ